MTPMIYSLNNIDSVYESCVEASRAANFNDLVVLKDAYKEQGPNRIYNVMF